MIDWTARAAALLHGNAHPLHRQNPRNTPVTIPDWPVAIIRNEVSEVSEVGGVVVLAKNALPLMEPANYLAEACARWTLHFADRNNLTVTFAPPVARDEVIRQYPDALAAVPPHDPPPAPQGCATCRHRTEFDNCGVPIEAGLSDVFRLERHPGGGVGCRAYAERPIAAEHRVVALLAAGLLDRDDASLIRMRYESDPDGWDQVLDGIERNAGKEE